MNRTSPSKVSVTFCRESSATCARCFLIIGGDNSFWKESFLFGDLQGAFLRDGSFSFWQPPSCSTSLLAPPPTGVKAPGHLALLGLLGPAVLQTLPQRPQKFGRGRNKPEVQNGWPDRSVETWTKTCGLSLLS